MSAECHKHGCDLVYGDDGNASVCQVCELEAMVERLREALQLIRGRYFPHDPDARVVWATETHWIARNALGLSSTAQAPSGEESKN